MQFVEKARNWVAIAANAVKKMEIDQGTTYQFESTLFHPNVHMMFVAVGDNFKTGEPYVFHQFGNGETATFNPGDFDAPLTTMYLFTMLTWVRVPGEGQDPYQYMIGPNDGEQNTGITDNAAAVFNYYFTSEKDKDKQFTEYDGDTVRLPGPIAEFVNDFFHSISPVAGKNWANFSLQQSQLQANTIIQLIAGYAGSKLLGVIENVENDKVQLEGSFDMSPLLEHSPNNNINMMAMIHPEEIAGEFVFQLGDPEKDGKIKLTTV